MVSRSFAVFQQLEIDYVVGESHKELMPDRSGPAAVIRIFGVTREGQIISLVFRWVLLVSSLVLNKGTSPAIVMARRRGLLKSSSLSGIVNLYDCMQVLSEGDYSYKKWLFPHMNEFDIR